MECYKMLECFGRTEALYERTKKNICKGYDISPTSFDVLVFLKNHPKQNTAKDICFYRGMKAGIISVEVEKLVKQGHLQRKSDEVDRRVQRLILQESSRSITDIGIQMQQKFCDDLLRNFSEAENAMYDQVIVKMCSTITELENEEKRGNIV